LIGDASIATARMLSLEAAGALVDEVKRVAKATLPLLDLTVVVGGQTRPSDLVERVHAAAARNGGVRDLHNVTVERRIANGVRRIVDDVSLLARQGEVLALMAEGRSNLAIAESLVVTPGAVEKHITNIFAKLELTACGDDHRRVLAVLTYLRLA